MKGQAGRHHEHIQKCWESLQALCGREGDIAVPPAYISRNSTLVGLLLGTVDLGATTAFWVAPLLAQLYANHVP